MEKILFFLIYRMSQQDMSLLSCDISAKKPHSVRRTNQSGVYAFLAKRGETPGGDGSGGQI
jgi:hypothetical protein